MPGRITKCKDLRREVTGPKSLGRLASCQEEAATLGSSFYPDVAKRFAAQEQLNWLWQAAWNSGREEFCGPGQAQHAGQMSEASEQVSAGLLHAAHSDDAWTSLQLRAHLQG